MKRKVGKDKFNVNPTILFTRLVALVQRGGTNCQQSQHPYRKSLYKEWLMWKLDKPQLRTALTSNIKHKDKAKTDHYVLDRRALLHRVGYVKRGTNKKQDVDIWFTLKTILAFVTSFSMVTEVHQRPL